MSGKRWVIYSTYDPQGLFFEPALEQVRAYRDLDASVLVVDTSPLLSDDRARGWAECASVLIRRENIGYDITSYRIGLDWLKAKEKEGTYAVLLANDSCYGPFFPLQPILERFENDSSASIFGITDSYEIVHHLQSYWLFFPPATVPELMLFFAGIGNIRDRQEAIHFGEIALSQHFSSRATALKAWCSARQLIEHLVPNKFSLFELMIRKKFKPKKRNLYLDRICQEYVLGARQAVPLFNPTIRAGAELFKYKLSPFVKRQFFRDGFYKPGIRLVPMTNSEASALLMTDRG